MSTEAEVASFLYEFKEKMKIWDVIFRDDRGKNAQALVDMELRPIDRKVVLETIEVQDYSEGPIDDELNGRTEMWVFGKVVRKKEVYIKVTMGVPGSHVICISFHEAQYQMNYLLK